MSSIAKRAGVVAGAGVIAFAITAIGQGLWGVMAIANVRFSPAIPWAPALMPFVLAALVAVLSGRAWPKAGAGARRALVPLAPVSARAWLWSLGAGLFAIAALAALWTVLGEIVQTPPNLLPDTRGVPMTTLAPMLLVSITAAPITEEIAFRGYAMGLIGRHFGPIATIVLSSVLFAAAHLTQGLYASKLIVYLLVGLALAATVWRTGSLLPAAVVHVFGDLVFFTLVWPHDGTRRLVSETGFGARFVLTLAVLAVCTGAWFYAFRRLIAATGRSDVPRPSAASLVAA
ncbi:MAG TPA: CPBP family intramembrane glutamic endopeptidase [Caulobacteraceae bacterium]|nr:CPBP family intramembrane glutamic endopeptidase [Caulobacteraceae bacterium]